MEEPTSSRAPTVLPIEGEWDRRARQVWPFLSVAALSVGGCASATDDGLPYADPTDAALTASTPTTLIASAPNVSFGASEADMIGFQAAWVCKFQRRTFTDPADAAAALASQPR